MRTDPKALDHPEDCAACWDDVMTAGGGHDALLSATSSHLERCPMCRESAHAATRLAEAMRALSVRLDDEVGQARSLLAGQPTAAMLVRLARYELWNRWARRACAAAILLAVGLAILVGTLPRSTRAPGGKPGEALALGPKKPLAEPRGPVTFGTDLKGSPAVAAIPVEGWIDLPPTEASADASVWWVVLHYGGHR